MKSTTEVVSKMNIRKKTPFSSEIFQPSERVSISTQAAEIVNQLFIELKAIFPAWRYAFPDDGLLEQAKKNWVKGFIENDICTMSQVQHGLQKARQSVSPHVPSIGQFITWCHPSLEDYGLLDEVAAYREACRNAHDLNNAQWSHQAVYVAAKQVGFFDLKTRTEKETFPLFKHKYLLVCRGVLSGKQVQQVIVKPLPQTMTSQPVDREVALAYIKQIRKLLRMR